MDGLQNFELTYTVDSQKEEELESVKLRNDPGSESNVQDLISLPYLHEPAILFCLERRYNTGNIYTYTGPILIALNPFQRLPLYTSEILDSYYKAGLLKAQGIETSEALPPHVFAIADAAYVHFLYKFQKFLFVHSTCGCYLTDIGP